MSSFTIGGIDLIMQGPKTAAPWQIILEMGRDLWPNGVYQDANEETIRPLAELLSTRPWPRSNEFFLYKDEKSAASWSEHGLTATNGSEMIHFLLIDDPEHAGLLQVTVVIGELTPDLAKFCGSLSIRLKQLLSSAKQRLPRQAPLKLTAELRKAGFELSPDDFLALLEGVRLALFPEWTKDELVCHPQEALAYCKEVRKQTKANLPDHIIMKALLNLRKRSKV